MQTFLPLPSFTDSALVLDQRRLGKQRVEAMQVLNAIYQPRHGWRRHPVAKMWSRHPLALAHYGIVVCERWAGLGYADSVRDKIIAIVAAGETVIRQATLPWWFGNEAFHSSHRSNLLRKDWDHYSRFWWQPADQPYLWPGATELEGWTEGDLPGGRQDAVSRAPTVRGPGGSPR